MIKKNLFFGLLLLLPFALNAGGVSEKNLVNTQAMDVSGLESISITYGADDIVFLESQDSQLVIKEYMTRDNKDYYAKITRSGSSLEIKEGKRPRVWNFSSKVEVYMPKAIGGSLTCRVGSGNIDSKIPELIFSGITLHTSSGDITAGNISAQTCAITVSSGSINVGKIIADTEIGAASGSIRLAEVSGDSHEIRSSSGKITIGSISGSESRISCSSGNIEIGEARRGMFYINSSSGGIHISSFDGKGTFDASSGDIKIDFMTPRGDIVFKVTSGSISMALPKASSFTLDAESSSGNVTLSSSDSGEKTRKQSILYSTGPSPAFTIKAKTSSGSINVELK